MIDGDRGIMGTEVFHRGRLKYGNHIDAMALIRRDFLLKVGGYHDIKFGWEDFDLWLRMCETNEYLVQIPEILGPLSSAPPIHAANDHERRKEPRDAAGEHHGASSLAPARLKGVRSLGRNSGDLTNSELAQDAQGEL